MSDPSPAVGARVEIQGLKARTDLNGCNGTVITAFDATTGRCGVRVHRNKEGINIKPENLKWNDDGSQALGGPKKKDKTGKNDGLSELDRALDALAAAGGTEEELDSDDENGDATPPEKYVDELIAVGDARNNLGQYARAGSLYYRAYYAVLAKTGAVNPPQAYPVAHKMIQAWIKSGDKYKIDMAHGMAQQMCMMPGAPASVRRDLQDAKRALERTR